VDIYGVGTKLASCAGEGGGALGGVYKLVRFDGRPRIKVTSDIAKATVPDRKRLLRVIDWYGNFLMDVLAREDEELAPGDVVYDPTNPSRHKPLPQGARFVEMREVVMEDGRINRPAPSLDEMADRCADQLRRLPNGSLRLFNPHLYKVSISRGLHELRQELFEKVAG
jgi:nicotinate phosphoribosyltransferase